MKIVGNLENTLFAGRDLHGTQNGQDIFVTEVVMLE